MLGQTKRSDTSFTVARTDGCEIECMASNTWRRKAAGTNGRGLPVDTSQVMVQSDCCTGSSANDNDGLANSDGSSVSLRWAVAMAGRSIEAQLTKFRSDLESASATTFDEPSIYLMSVEI